MARPEADGCPCGEDDCVLYEPGHPPLGRCTESECGLCGHRDCPDGEPMHYHHDGCPACYSEGRPCFFFTLNEDARPSQ